LSERELLPVEILQQRVQNTRKGSAGDHETPSADSKVNTQK